MASWVDSEFVSGLSRINVGKLPDDGRMVKVSIQLLSNFNLTPVPILGLLKGVCAQLKPRAPGQCPWVVYSANDS